MTQELERLIATADARQLADIVELVLARFRALPLILPGYRDEAVDWWATVLSSLVEGLDYRARYHLIDVLDEAVDSVRLMTDARRSW